MPQLHKHFIVGGNFMRIIFLIIVLISIGCHLDVKVTKKYELYFDEPTYRTFLKAFSAFNKKDHQLADSLFTIVINNSKDKLSMTMPAEFNPYYFRGHNSFDLNNYKQALSDFEHVASDTTTNTDILLARTEAFRMLQQYDTAIVLCDRLLGLQFDSSIILSQRGICYYQKGQIEKACHDLHFAKKLATGDVSFLEKFLKDCE